MPRRWSPPPDRDPNVIASDGRVGDSELERLSPPTAAYARPWARAAVAAAAAAAAEQDTVVVLAAKAPAPAVTRLRAQGRCKHIASALQAPEPPARRPCLPNNQKP